MRNLNKRKRIKDPNEQGPSAEELKSIHANPDNPEYESGITFAQRSENSDRGAGIEVTATDFGQLAQAMAAKAEAVAAANAREQETVKEAAIPDVLEEVQEPEPPVVKPVAPITSPEIKPFAARRASNGVNPVVQEKTVVTPEPVVDPVVDPTPTSGTVATPSASVPDVGKSEEPSIHDQIDAARAKFVELSKKKDEIHASMRKMMDDGYESNTLSDAVSSIASIDGRMGKELIGVKAGDDKGMLSLLEKQIQELEESNRLNNDVLKQAHTDREVELKAEKIAAEQIRKFAEQTAAHLTAAGIPIDPKAFVAYSQDGTKVDTNNPAFIKMMQQATQPMREGLTEAARERAEKSIAEAREKARIAALEAEQNAKSPEERSRERSVAREAAWARSIAAAKEIDRAAAEFENGSSSPEGRQKKMGLFRSLFSKRSETKEKSKGLFRGFSDAINDGLARVSVLASSALTPIAALAPKTPAGRMAALSALTGIGYVMSRMGVHIDPNHIMNSGLSDHAQQMASAVPTTLPFHTPAGVDPVMNANLLDVASHQTSVQQAIQVAQDTGHPFSPGQQLGGAVTPEYLQAGIDGGGHFAALHQAVSDRASAVAEKVTKHTHTILRHARHLMGMETPAHGVARHALTTDDLNRISLDNARNGIPADPQTEAAMDQPHHHGVGHDISHAAKEAGHGIQEGAEKTGNGFKKAGHWLGEKLGLVKPSHPATEIAQNNPFSGPGKKSSTPNIF